VKRLLQILLGLILILVLAYVGFLEVSVKIKDDLPTKAAMKLREKGILHVNAAIEGEGLSISRTLALTGSVASEEERKRAVSVVQKIEGVANVNSYMTVEKVKETPLKIVSVPKVESIITKASASIPTTKIATKEEAVKERIKKEALPTQTEKQVEPLAVQEVKENNQSALLVASPVKTPSVPVVTQKIVTVEALAIKEVKENNQSSLLLESPVKTPSVPIVMQQVVEVPKPIKSIDVPVVIEVESQNIKIEGVK